MYVVKKILPLRTVRTNMSKENTGYRGNYIFNIGKMVNIKINQIQKKQTVFKKKNFDVHTLLNYSD
jgi:hypothetical protein